MKYKDSEYVKRYKKRMMQSIKLINPDWSSDKVEKIIDKMIDKQIKNPKVIMDNNFTGEQKEASLISVFDWTFANKPIIAGNGTFYKNQYQALNPTANMLMDMLKTRKATKKKMFRYPEGSDEYKDLDRQQKNHKINANSYYGGSGMPTSAFYSTWSGPATTSSAQIVISTTENTFEAFIVDNYRFIDINELFDWLFAVLDDSDLVIDNWICDVSDEKLFNRLYSKIINKSKNDEIILKQIISNMCDQDKKFVYYKNNLLEFISDHMNVLNLYRSIFLNVNNYEYFTDDDWEKNIKRYGFTKEQFGSKKKWDSFVNKEYFMDPNDVPDTIKDDVEELSNILMKYIYVPYMPFDRIYRLKNFKRRCVTVIDTDSNILALDTFVNYTLNHVLTSNYGREKMNNVFIAVNTITYIITKVVTDILLLYGKYANIPEEYRPSLNMKNELTKGSYKTSLIAGTNKRYDYQVLWSNPKMANRNGFWYGKKIILFVNPQPSFCYRIDWFNGYRKYDIS